MTSESEIVNVVFTELSAVFSKDINASNVVYLITKTMETVEKYKSMDRANIVKNVVGRFVDMIQDEGVRRNVKLAVDTLLPAIITNICQVARGNYGVNQPRASQLALLWSHVRACFGRK